VNVAPQRHHPALEECMCLPSWNKIQLKENADFDLELHVHVAAKISMTFLILLLYRRVLAVASMVRQA
jgi:hypothetical protein